MTVTTVDYFERLGLPRRFSVDPTDVERRYLALSRQTHPDFHGGSSDAIEQTATLNQAYVTLRDPFRRAEHLLTVLGGPTAQQEKSLDQRFLMDMMDLRERVEEAKSATADLGELDAELVRQYTDVLADIGGRLDRLLGASGDSLQPDPSQLVQVRRRLNAAKTIQSLLREVRDTPDRS
jgi:molecular chaperone HscB